MEEEAIRVTGGPIRAVLAGLMVGLIGLPGVLGPGGVAVGSCLDDGAGHGPTEVRVMRATAQVMTVTPTEGQQVVVPGTELTVAVKVVKDFTSEGCVGGPVGCRDRVELEVTRGGKSQEIVLYVAHTQAQRTRGVQQAGVFGYTIVLTALQGKRITLSVEKNP